MLKYLFVVILCSVASMGHSKSISFSFDDIPRANSYLTGAKRAQQLISSLKEHSARAVFYVNTSKVSSEGLARIIKYAKAGHIIGNHTHSHPSADIIRADVCLAEFQTADDLLRSWGYQPSYFRYPFLHRGKTSKKNSAIRSQILSKGYQDGFVTIDNYDWYMDQLFQKAIKSNQEINFDKLKSFYVETLYKGIVHYENLAIRVYGRSPKHVMLLHENDLAALFVKDLIAFLKLRGWEICTPAESYNDPDLIKYPKNVLRHGQGRVVAHATAKGFAKPLLSGLEDEEVLDQLWSDYNVITTVDKSSENEKITSAQKKRKR